jgi:hypothetical protein
MRPRVGRCSWWVTPSASRSVVVELQIRQHDPEHASAISKFTVIGVPPEDEDS